MQVETDLSRVGDAFEGIDAFIGRGRHVRLLSNASSLRWVQTLTAGADAVDFTDLERRGIVLTNGSGIHAINLAEHLLVLMLAFARNLPELLRRQERHEWSQQGHQFELHGQSLCIVGLGDIGLALAERAAALGMRVTGVRRRDLPCPEYVAAVARLDTMDELLAEADHVAICLPLTARTGTVFDAGQLRALKRGGFIYNIGRGDLIDQNALIEMLADGHLAGAGLDVTTPEPLPPDNPLWDAPNVIITNHTGGHSPRRLDRFIDLLLDNITRYRASQLLRNIVDPVEGY